MVVVNFGLTICSRDAGSSYLWNHFGAMRRLLVLTGFAVAMGITAPAHASPDEDQALLVSLNAAGIKYKDTASVITTGRAVCEMAAAGKSGVEVVQVLQSANPGLSQENAARFTAIAAGVYCPKQLPAGS